MISLFRHSLIKITVLYHLKEINIAWSTFIANPIFTNSSTQNVQSIPSSSHPSTSIPPSQPIDHSSSFDQSPSPSSPFHEHIHSPNKDEIIEQDKIGQVEVIKPKGADLGTLTHIYQRGHRQVFAPQIVGGALPSSLAKRVKKGKEKMTETKIQREEEVHHETEQDFDLVDLGEHNDNESTSIVIKEKDALIRELQINLERSKYILIL